MSTPDEPKGIVIEVREDAEMMDAFFKVWQESDKFFEKGFKVVISLEKGDKR